MKNLRMKIHGKVQGVFFRIFIKNKIERTGLVGWVRNENDNTVALEVEGEIEELKNLIQQCQEGSPSSIVEKIEHEFSSELKGYDSFKILR